MFPENDDQFQEKSIAAVKRNGSGWAITNDDGWSFFVPGDSPVEPAAGMACRMYGRGIGATVRGLFIDGRQVFYRTEADDREHWQIQMYGADAADLLARWDRGDTCHTIEMGGIGPGYEQAIHIMVFEMIRYMLANPVDWPRADEDQPYWREYTDTMDKTLFVEGAPCQVVGPSGAQYGAACSLAAQFVRRGPREVMNDARVKDRHIIVRRSLPGAA